MSVLLDGTLAGSVPVAAQRCFAFVSEVFRRRHVVAVVSERWLACVLLSKPQRVNSLLSFGLPDCQTSLKDVLDHGIKHVCGQ